MEAVLTSEPDLMHHRAGSDPWALTQPAGQETSRWPHRPFSPGILRCCARASCYSVRKLTLALKIQSGRKKEGFKVGHTVVVSFLISSLFFLTFFPAFLLPFITICIIIIFHLELEMPWTILNFYLHHWTSIQTFGCYFQSSEPETRTQNLVAKTTFFKWQFWQSYLQIQ